MNLTITTIEIGDVSERALGAILTDLFGLMFDAEQPGEQPEADIPANMHADYSPDYSQEPKPRHKPARRPQETPAPTPTPEVASEPAAEPEPAEAASETDLKETTVDCAAPEPIRPPKPGMLATPAEQHHFRNVHGAPKPPEPDKARKVKPGDLPAVLRALKPGDEFIVVPAPKHINNVAMQISHARRRGEIDRRISVAKDAEGNIRVIFHPEAVTA